jgi:tRNA(Arg) A34 adenosine deaminase TadA
MKKKSFIDLAFEEAKGSPHPTVKVGAVVVAPDGKTILGQSNNNFADGVKNKPKRLKAGEKSMWLMCAEKRALTEARRNLKKNNLQSLKGCHIYSTLSPCTTCADDIISAEIKTVSIPYDDVDLYVQLKEKWRKSIIIGEIKLKEAGIPLKKI